MSRLAIVLAAAVAVAGPAPRTHHRVAPSLRLAKKAPVHKGIRIKRPAAAAPHPSASPVAGEVVPGASPAPTATPAPVHPSRTKLSLNDPSSSVPVPGPDRGAMFSSYDVLEAGSIELNVYNYGEDDHNLTIRGVDGAAVFLAPGDNTQLDVTLAPGTYTLYCSLQDHEARGMWLQLSVK